MSSTLFTTVNSSVCTNARTAVSTNTTLGQAWLSCQVTGIAQTKCVSTITFNGTILTNASVSIDYRLASPLATLLSAGTNSSGNSYYLGNVTVALFSGTPSISLRSFLILSCPIFLGAIRSL
ncbi:unnamed protein product [Calicophoron daubneyi]|uniref:Uncharacterized protein n=1 Tax=Calicophoron daubneyi TaxID=300641 RepID=A0AAV2TXN2_CALDB